MKDFCLHGLCFQFRFLVQSIHVSPIFFLPKNKKTLNKVQSLPDRNNRPMILYKRLKAWQEKVGGGREGN